MEAVLKSNTDPTRVLGLVSLEMALNGPEIGPKMSIYLPGQLVALRHQHASPSIAKVAEDRGPALRVYVFSPYREAFLVPVWVPRDQVMGVAL